MQGLSALVMSAVIAASSPAARNIVHPAEAPAAGAGEAYVAELDADWNVTRETRVACPAESGCVVDLDLADAALAAVHVRFAPPRGGVVDVTSRLEDRAGGASAPQAESLALDRTGFGAGHYEARTMVTGVEGRTIMMAVKVPGWSAPGIVNPALDAQRT